MLQAQVLEIHIEEVRDDMYMYGMLYIYIYISWQLSLMMIYSSQIEITMD